MRILELTTRLIKVTGPSYEPKLDLDIPERLLAQLWQRRAANQASFRSPDGHRVRVLYSGRPGPTAGPDFRDALLEVEGVVLVQGDVEIHVRERDWKSHGHGDDPRYNGVVLYAALDVQSASTQLQSGQNAPVISLAALMSDDGSEDDGRDQGGSLWEILGAQGYPKPPATQSRWGPYWTGPVISGSPGRAGSSKPFWRNRTRTRPFMKG